MARLPATISPLWVRDAGGRGASERHRRAGDAPPSPWPPKGLVSGLERLYGPVSRWQRMAIMGPLRSGTSQPLRNLCPCPRLRGPVETTQTRYDLVSEATGTAGRLLSAYAPGPPGVAIAGRLRCAHAPSGSFRRNPV